MYWRDWVGDSNKMGFVFILSGVKYLWMENSRPQGTEFVSPSELLHSVLDHIEMARSLHFSKPIQSEICGQTFYSSRG